MANIINVLSRAILKEEFWILPDGRTVSRETMLKHLTPEYMAKVKSGEAAHLSLSEYMDSRADEFFMTADLLAEIKAAINPGPDEEPATPAEDPDEPEDKPAHVEEINGNRYITDFIEPIAAAVPAEHLDDI